MVAEVINAAIAPLTEPAGWQAFAYGLLGVKTISRTIDTIKQIRNGNTGDN